MEPESSGIARSPIAAADNGLKRKAVDMRTARRPQDMLYPCVLS